MISNPVPIIKQLSADAGKEYVVSPEQSNRLKHFIETILNVNTGTGYISLMVNDKRINISIVTEKDKL